MSEGTGTIRCTDRDGDAHLPSAYPRANGEERDTEKEEEKVDVEKDEDDSEEESDIVWLEQRKYRNPRIGTVSSERESDAKKSKEAKNDREEMDLISRKHMRKEASWQGIPENQETLQSRKNRYGKIPFENKDRNPEEKREDSEISERQNRTEREISEITTEEDNKDKDREGVRNPPIPVPRRSTRQKKPPDRYGNTVSHQMVQPVDSRITKLDSLIKSGVFSDLDQEAMNIVLSAVIKRFFNICKPA